MEMSSRWIFLAMIFTIATSKSVEGAMMLFFAEKVSGVWGAGSRFRSIFWLEVMQTFLQRKIVGGLAMRKSVFTLMALTCASAAGMAQTAY